jgi:hypothetical protein
MPLPSHPYVEPFTSEVLCLEANSKIMLEIFKNGVALPFRVPAQGL